MRNSRWVVGCLLLCQLARGQEGTPAARPHPAGVWHAWLDSPGGKLLFGLELEGKGASPSAWLRNGEERIDIPRVEWDGRELLLDIDHYDSRIRATFADGGQRLDGKWRKRRGANRFVEMRFHASRSDPGVAVATDTATEPKDKKQLAAIAGRWAVQFEKDRHPAVGLFEARADGTARGTFLTTLGDYRFLAGRVRGSKLSLSCFDGAHAFLFAATLGQNGQLRGDFWSSTSWHEKWSARKDAHAALPDAYRLTSVRPARAKASLLAGLSFPDTAGKMRRLDDPAFAGSARLIVVFGSWCPNCHDEGAYLAELDRRYRKRGLSILGLAFEHTGDLDRDTAQVKVFARRHGIRFPILIAGLSDKKKAAQALPFLDRVRAYPTTVFLHADGGVRAVHTGFSGPATGEEHRRLRRGFEGLIEELIGR